jgi:4-hydroxybenzoate polyprenyltransferase/phosphoserine phosphatase
MTKVSVIRRKRGERLPGVVSATESTRVTLRPLCVDLDGTLVKSDTLHDSLLVLARKRRSLLLALPLQLLRGKAAFKAFVTESISLDVARLPYNRKLIRYLVEQHLQGREIYLATGANIELARRVAAHLGIFKEVLGSDNTLNLTGNSKLERLRSSFGYGEFDYIGNATPDLPLLEHSTEPMVANPSLALRVMMRARKIKPALEFCERRNLIAALTRAMRPHQWTKNLLLLVPLLLSHAVNLANLTRGLLAFCCFCLAASGTYIANDLLDIEADRHHHQKRRRPFAAGDLSPIAGALAASIFLAFAFAAMRGLPLKFSVWLLIYVVATMAYSVWLKRVPIVDVLVLSGLYTLRLLAGSSATGSHVSHWLSGFSIFLFFSLAIAKRYAELDNLRTSKSAPKNGRGYMLADVEQLRAFGTASAFAAVVIFANYISGRDVTVLYRDPSLLWLIVPLMILWLCRVWLLASRGSLHEDPVVFALTDRMSLLIGIAATAVVMLAI